MKTTVGRFDPESRTVEVTFAHAGIKHTRPVNAVLDAKGKYDAAATKARVEEVARGVERKIDLGVITDAPPPPPPAETPAG